jgi:hypothetical protein
MPVFTEESSPEMLQRAAGLKKPPLPRVSAPAPLNTDRTADGALHEVVVIGVRTMAPREEVVFSAPRGLIWLRTDRPGRDHALTIASPIRRVLLAR